MLFGSLDAEEDHFLVCWDAGGEACVPGKNTALIHCGGGDGGAGSPWRAEGVTLSELIGCIIIALDPVKDELFSRVYGLDQGVVSGGR